MNRTYVRATIYIAIVIALLAWYCSTLPVVYLPGMKP